MNNAKFDIYLEFNFTKLNLAAFNKLNNNLEYYDEYKYNSYFENNIQLDFEELEKILEKNIRKIEKSVGEYVKDIYLIVETPQSMPVKLSVNKNNEGKKIIREDVTYLIQDAKQQIMKFYKDLKILHIIVEKYTLDNNHHEFLPLGKSCNKLSIDIKFICFPKTFIKSFENLFSKQQIFIKKFICQNYVKSFVSEDTRLNICQRGKNIVDGANKREVVSIPKQSIKKGIFEKLFHFFS